MPRAVILWPGDVLRGEGGFGVLLIASELEACCRGKYVFRDLTMRYDRDQSDAEIRRNLEQIEACHPSIVLTTANMGPIERLIKERNIPLMGLLNRSSIPSVGGDSNDTCRMSIDYLMGRGIKDIALIGGSSTSYYGKFRAAHSMDWPEAWCVMLPSLNSMYESEALGYEAFNRIWAHPRKPKGLIVVDDILFRGAAYAMARHGVEPMRDLVVVSQWSKNSPLFVPVPFVRMELDTTEYAARIIEMIEKLIANSSVPPEHTCILPRLVPC